MKKKILILTIFLTLCSCALFTKSEDGQLNFKIETATEDYSDHLKSLGRDYLNSPKIKQVYISKSSRKYLLRLYNRIVSNNELLLNNSETPKFYIIRSKLPFYFSLPGSSFFFSSILIKKYLRSEELFMSLLSSEIIKSQKQIYLKKMIVPVGYMRTERMLSLTRSSLALKHEINKWAYYTMKRSGVDPSAYLMWMQIQNRNTLEFSMQNAGVQSISREEYLFKNFIASKGAVSKIAEIKIENSSRKFYRFLNEIK